MTTRTDIAVLIDLENQLNLDLATVRSHITAEVGGRVAVARAYANWASTRHAAHRKQVGDAGIVPVQCGSFGAASKNAADIELAVDALRLADTSPSIETFVIITADGDFTPVAHRLRELGRHVIIASVETHRPSQHVRAAVDAVISLPTSGAAKAETVDVVAEAPAASAPMAKAAPQDRNAQKDYRAAIRDLLDDPKAAAKFRNLAGNRAPMSSVSTMLKKAAPDLDHSAAGFKTLASALRHSLAGTIFEVTTPKEKGEQPRLVVRP